MKLFFLQPLDFSGLYWKVWGYLVNTIGNLVQGGVSIVFQNENYDNIIKAIWVTVMILDFQFKIKSVKK